MQQWNHFLLIEFCVVYQASRSCIEPAATKCFNELLKPFCRKVLFSVKNHPVLVEYQLNNSNVPLQGSVYQSRDQYISQSSN